MKYPITPPSSIYLFGTFKPKSTPSESTDKVYYIDDAPELDEAVRLAEEYVERVEKSRKITDKIIQNLLTQS